MHGKYFLPIISVAIDKKLIKKIIFADKLLHILRKNTIVQVTFILEKSLHNLAFLNTEFETAILQLILLTKDPIQSKNTSPPQLPIKH